MWAIILMNFVGSVAVAASPITVTPDNLQDLLFTGSSDVAKEMNNVLRAKNNVDVAFGNLIPSLSFNLGVVVANPPLFLLSSVSCLVPFLFPSNWHGYDAARNEAKAEASALEITRLNAFAAAYALLSRFSNDEAVLALLIDERKRLEEYVQTLRDKADTGLIPQLEALQAELGLRKMSLDVSRISEVIGIERAALRKMLGLGLDQPFDIRFADDPPSVLERLAGTQGLVDLLIARAPEHRQLELLMAGAKDRVKASYWAFLAGCAGTQGSWGPSGSNAFTFSSTFAISIGYGNFPQISLSKRNVDDLSIREKDLSLEFARLLDGAQQSIVTLKQRMDDAAKAAELGERILTEQTLLVDRGKVTRKDILDTTNGISRAKVEFLNAKTALEGHRVTLKRLALEGKFFEVLVSSRREFAPGPKTARRGD